LFIGEQKYDKKANRQAKFKQALKGYGKRSFKTIIFIVVNLFIAVSIQIGALIISKTGRQRRYKAN